jgi:orotate phosphoribosyltransferase
MIKVEYKSPFFTQDLKSCAHEYLQRLPGEVDGLVSIGSSGCAIASAMMVLSNRIKTNVCIRKSDEKSHNNSPTGLHGKASVYAIVDDFIDTGTTVLDLINRAREWGCQVKYILVDHIHIMGEAQIKFLEKLNTLGICCITMQDYHD